MIEVHITVLPSQRLFVICIESDHGHDINEQLGDGETRKHTGSCSFKREVVYRSKRDRVASDRDCFAIHTGAPRDNRWKMLAELIKYLRRATRGDWEINEASACSLVLAAINKNLSSLGLEKNMVEWSKSLRCMSYRWPLALLCSLWKRWSLHHEWNGTEPCSLRFPGLKFSKKLRLHIRSDILVQVRTEWTRLRTLESRRERVERELVWRLNLMIYSRGSRESMAL